MALFVKWVWFAQVGTRTMKFIKAAPVSLKLTDLTGLCLCYLTSSITLSSKLAIIYLLCIALYRGFNGLLLHGLCQDSQCTWFTGLLIYVQRQWSGRRDKTLL